MAWRRYREPRASPRCCSPVETPLTWSCSSLQILLLIIRRHRLRRRDLAVYVPQIFPGLVVLPKKDLTFDQAAIAIDAQQSVCISLFGKRVADRTRQVCAIVVNWKTESASAPAAPPT